MPKKQITIPRFRSEAEEAKWWDSHPEVATDIMKRDQIGQGSAGSATEDNHDALAGSGSRGGPGSCATKRSSIPDVHQNAFA
jgi:hypothetical protein